MADKSAYRVDRVERLITSLDQGGFAQELADDLHKAVQTVEEHQQTYGNRPKARLTIKLEINRNERGQIVVSGSHDLALPKVPAAEEVFFATEDNRLTAQNPNVDTMFPGDDLGRRNFPA